MCSSSECSEVAETITNRIEATKQHLGALVAHLQTTLAQLDSETAMVLHGKSKRYKVKVMRTEHGLSIGAHVFPHNAIYEIEAGDTCSHFIDNPPASCCITLVSAMGLVLLQAASEQERDALLNWLNKRCVFSKTFYIDKAHEPAHDEDQGRSSGVTVEQTDQSQNDTVATDVDEEKRGRFYGVDDKEQDPTDDGEPKHNHDTGDRDEHVEPYTFKREATIPGKRNGVSLASAQESVNTIQSCSFVS